MAKQGEIDYLKNAGESGIQHAYDRPFSDPERGKALMEVSAILSLLPAPPARLLDLGCGTGWTSCFFARSGYEVVGQDISPDMIYHANRNKQRYEADNLSFITGDYEDLAFQNEFDCAVFFDSLHHAVDEQEALCQVYRALRPGGMCIASEPGEGHQQNAHTIEAVERFQVTEKDMPPRKIIALGKKAGFTAFKVLPQVGELRWQIYMNPETSLLLRFLKLNRMIFWRGLYKQTTGMVVMSKAA